MAIIGVLASVVLASLNSARAKGIEAAIKSNLKNMIPEAELAYDTAGNYSTACAAVAKMMTAIINAGGTPACATFDNTRWGVSAKLNSDSTKNWAVDGNGVVTWDTTYAPDTSKTWSDANTFCAGKGGRLPSIEELKALSLAYGSTAPPGFISDLYWSGTTFITDSARAYYVFLTNGAWGSGDKTSWFFVRCVH